MQAITRKVSVAFAVFLTGTFFAINARAQCGAADGHATSNNASSILSRSVPLRASVNGPVSSLHAAISQQSKPEESDGSIVGFWHVVFTSEGTTNPPIPDGAVVDNGFAQWHSDKTEIMNSSWPPATGNFCLGVWEKTGRFTYNLNHFGLSFNPDGSMVGPANIRESVGLAVDGNSYSGTFSIDQYDTHLNLLAHIVGTISATRVNVDTQPSDLF
jgi:hypothetical protein